MKLNNQLIVTLPDFARNFDYQEFWANRRQFVRDMNPERFYYWQDGQVNAYYDVKAWIESNGKDEKLKDKGIAALGFLLGGNVDLKAMSFTSSGVDISKRIIKVNAGHILEMPAFSGAGQKNLAINLHKMIFEGSAQKMTKVYVGGQYASTFYGGDVVYFTELNGGCIELLPNRIKGRTIELGIINDGDRFGSKLIVQNYLGGENVFNGIVSFGIVNDGYIFIDEDGKPVYMTNIPKFLLKSDSPALYVKGQGDNALILYRNGNLRSTSLGMATSKNIISADFSPEGKLITKNI